MLSFSGGERVKYKDHQSRPSTVFIREPDGRLGEREGPVAAVLALYPARKVEASTWAGPRSGTAGVDRDARDGFAEALVNL